MTTDEKRKFIRTLMGNIKADAIRATKFMPEEWNGIELRWYLAEKFRRSETARGRFGFDRNRRRVYENEMTVNRNL